MRAEVPLTCTSLPDCIMWDAKQFEPQLEGLNMAAQGTHEWTWGGDLGPSLTGAALLCSSRDLLVTCAVCSGNFATIVKVVRPGVK